MSITISECPTWQIASSFFVNSQNPNSSVCNDIQQRITSKCCGMYLLTHFFFWWSTEWSVDSLQHYIQAHTAPCSVPLCTGFGESSTEHCEPILFFKMRSWNTFRSLLKSICQSHTSIFKTTPNTKKSTNLDTLMNWLLKLTYLTS